MCKVNQDIDITKLSRDYLLHPLSKGELPNIDDIKYLYIELNLFHKDVAEYFNVVPRTFTKWLNKLNIKKPNVLKRTNINKTNIKKYGKENIFQTDLFKDKREQTCKERYNVNYSTQSYNIKQKIKQSINDKYNVDSYNQTLMPSSSLKILSSKDLLKDFIISQSCKNLSSISFELKISHSTLRRYVDMYSLDYLIEKSITESNYEKELQKLFPNMSFHNRDILDGKEIDLFDNVHNIGIEFNGDYWHNENYKEKTYHQDKSLLAESKGIFIYHIFEHVWKSKKNIITSQINHLLGKTTNKIYARKCIVKEVDDKNKSLFLETNHLHGDVKSSINLGLYYNDILVSIMTFRESNEYVLESYCSLLNTSVIGGTSKLFKHFIKLYNPSSIITYCDFTHYNGNIFNLLGFKYQNLSEPIYDSNYKLYNCGNKVWRWDKL